MTREEIKNYIEEAFEWHMAESGMEREEVYETVVMNAVYAYYNDHIELEDLMGMMEELEFELDVERVKEIKVERKYATLRRRFRNYRKRKQTKVTYMHNDEVVVKVINGETKHYFNKDKADKWLPINDLKINNLKRLGEIKVMKEATLSGMTPESFFDRETE